MNILITGGTGFVGSALVEAWSEQGHHITILTRTKKNIDSRLNPIESLEEISDDDVIDYVVNLAGASINRRWSENYKRCLVDSRLEVTRRIVKLVRRLQHKPKLLISASAIGYYGSHEHKYLDENAFPRNEFTHYLCRQWEQEALKVEQYGTRVCIARLGVVLDKDGGALKKVILPFKLRVGGKIGSSKQYFSWVHRKDVVAAFNFFINNQQCHGAYNVTAPNPVTNAQFTEALGAALGVSTSVPMPGFMVKLIFGEMGETLLLRGQRVIPKKLQDDKFEFQYATIDDALQEILT